MRLVVSAVVLRGHAACVSSTRGRGSVTAEETQGCGQTLCRSTTCTAGRARGTVSVALDLLGMLGHVARVLALLGGVPAPFHAPRRRGLHQRVIVTRHQYVDRHQQRCSAADSPVPRSLAVCRASDERASRDALLVPGMDGVMRTRVGPPRWHLALSFP